MSGFPSGSLQTQIDPSRAFGAGGTQTTWDGASKSGAGGTTRCYSVKWGKSQPSRSPRSVPEGIRTLQFGLSQCSSRTIFLQRLKLLMQFRITKVLRLQMYVLPSLQYQTHS